MKNFWRYIYAAMVYLIFAPFITEGLISVIEFGKQVILPEWKAGSSFIVPAILFTICGFLLYFILDRSYKKALDFVNDKSFAPEKIGLPMQEQNDSPSELKNKKNATIYIAAVLIIVPFVFHASFYFNLLKNPFNLSTLFILLNLLQLLFSFYKQGKHN